MTPRPPIVEVEWIDACEESTEHRLSAVDEAVTLKHRFNTGYLVNDKPDRISLAFGIDPPESLDDEMEAATFITIPRGWIKGDVRYLTRKPKKAKIDG